MRRIVLAGCMTIALTAVGAATVGAQAENGAPTVNVMLGAGGATITGADDLKAGTTRFLVQSEEGRGNWALAELKPDVSNEEFREALEDIRGPQQVRRYGVIVAGGDAPSGHPYTTYVSLKQARYALVDITREPSLRAVITTGTPANTVPPPEPDVEVALRNFRFDMPNELPREGFIRFRNPSDQHHEAVLFRLRSGVSPKRFVKNLKRGKVRERQVAAGYGALGAIDGTVVNDVPLRLRPARYVMACFLPDERKKRGKPHVALGMAKALRVR